MEKEQSLTCLYEQSSSPAVCTDEHSAEWGHQEGADTRPAHSNACSESPPLLEVEPNSYHSRNIHEPEAYA